jgi:3-hydroxyisobutyrate dehydrogenase
VENARKAHAFFADKDCLTLDAPVSGGTSGAAAGALTFMIGGATAAFAKGEPILQKNG